MQPGHLLDNQVQAEQRYARPYHYPAGDTQHAHHRLLTRAANGGLRNKEKVRARTHQRNDMHQRDGEEKRQHN